MIGLEYRVRERRVAVYPLPLGARLEVGGDGADVTLAPDADSGAGVLVLDHRLGGVVVEAAEGFRSAAGGALQRGVALAPGDVLRLGAHALTLVADVAESVPPAAAPALPGYRVEGLLGQGGSGQVYSGTCLADGQRVALKWLDPEADGLTAARFRRELELLGDVRLQGVARVRGLEELPDGRAVLVRELIPGPTLAERLAEGPLDPDAALALGVELAAALGRVHAAGVVHRDLKPANVVLGPSGPVLIDFDLARRSTPAKNLRTLTRLTQSGVGLGSLAYLPPEQLRAAHEADARADVYGLGAVLYHALAGAPPFAQVPPEAFLEALAAGPAPLPPAGLPPGASAILARATAADPAARHTDGAELAAALRATLGWTLAPEQWTLTLSEAPAGEPPAELLADLPRHPGHLRIELGELEPNGSETARLVSFLRALSEVCRPPLVLVRAPQDTAHSLYKVGLAPRFALDDPRSERGYPG